MTILAPILMASLIIVPVFLANQDQQNRLIAVSEDNTKYSNKINDTDNINFEIITEDESEKIRKNLTDSPYYAILDIKNNTFTLYASQQIGLNIRNSIQNQLEKIIEREKLKQAGIDIKIIENSKTKINIETKIIDTKGEA